MLKSNPLGPLIDESIIVNSFVSFHSGDACFFFNILFLFFRNVKYHEPEYWKFGEEGNKYFRHATGQIYAISKDLATYISINQ